MAPQNQKAPVVIATKTLSVNENPTYQNEDSMYLPSVDNSDRSGNIQGAVVDTNSLTKPSGAIEFSILSSSKGRANKGFSLDSEGRLVKDSGCKATEGTLQRVFATTATEVGKIIDKLGVNEAISNGIHNLDFGAGVGFYPLYMAELNGGAARVGEQMNFPRYGLFPIDADEAGVDHATLRVELAAMLPYLAGVGVVAKPSNSANIWIEQEQLTKNDRSRLYYLCDFGAEEAERLSIVKRVVADMALASWMNLRSRFEFSKPSKRTGLPNILERHEYFDTNVYQTNRVFYDGSGTYADGLKQLDGGCVCVEGDILELASIPALTPEFRAKAEKIRDRARAKMAIKRQKMAEDLVRAENPSWENKRVRKTAKERIEKTENKQLRADDKILFSDGSVVLVADITAEHVGRDCYDPDEPDYQGGKVCAKVFQRNDGSFCVSSFAHGDHTYFFPAVKPGRSAVKPSGVELLNVPVVLQDYGTDSIYQMVVENLGIFTGVASENWMTCNGSFYNWVGTHWSEVDKESIVRSLTATLKYVQSESASGKLIRKFGDPKIVAGCMAHIQNCFGIPFSKIGRKGLNLSNGILDVTYGDDGRADFELKEHDRNRYFLTCSPTAYDSKADTEPAMTMLQSLEQDQLETFLRHFSMAIDIDSVLARIGRPKAGFMIGNGSNGKDSIGRMFGFIFGEVGNFSLDDFKKYDNGSQFGLSRMPQHRISFAGENNHYLKLETLSSWKGAVACTLQLNVERKGVDSVTYSPTLTHFYALNDSPFTDGTKESVKSRIAIYPFRRTYTNDPAMLKRPNHYKPDQRFLYNKDFLANEVAPGFLLLVLEAYKRMISEGCVDWTVTSRELANWASNSNHIHSWAKDVGLVEAEDACTSIKDLFGSLTSWYDENNYATVIEINGSVKVQPGRDEDKYDRLVVRSRDMVQKLVETFGVSIEKNIDKSGKVCSKNGVYVRGLALPGLSKTIAGEVWQAPVEEEHADELTFEAEFEYEADEAEVAEAEVAEAEVAVQTELVTEEAIVEIGDSVVHTRQASGLGQVLKLDRGMARVRGKKGESWVKVADLKVVKKAELEECY